MKGIENMYTNNEKNTFEKKENYSLGDNEIATKRLGLLNRMFEPSSSTFIKTMTESNLSLALDLGCGPGHTTEMISKSINPKLTIGIDISLPHLNHATPNSAIHFIQHDVSISPLPNAPADLIYSRFLLSHLSNPLLIIENWLENLKPSGILLLEEDEWTFSNNLVIQEYFKIVADLIAFNGGNMYIGRKFENLSLNNDLKIKHNKVQKVSPPIELTIQNFILNFKALREQNFIINNYSQAYLNILQDNLEKILLSPSNTVVEWGMRQVAITK